MPGWGHSLRTLAALLAGAAGPACSGGGAADGPQAGGDPSDGARPAATAPPGPIVANVPPLAARRLHALGVEPEFLLAADLDGDGARELVVTSNDPGELRVLSAAGERRFSVDGWPLRPLVAAREGKARLVLASREERTLVWLDPRRPPAAATVRREALPATPRALAAGDLGADGAGDVVVACDRRALVWFRGDGPPIEAELSGELPRCAAIAADGTGLWIGFQDTRAIAFRPYQDGALGPPRVTALDGIPRSLLEADLDGDGDFELAVAGGDETVWVFGLGRPGGASSFDASPPERRRAQAIPIDLEAGDLDGDGRPELVVLNAAALEWLQWRAAEDGSAALVSRGLAGQTPRDGALLDLDGDGDLDYAVTNRDSSALSLVWNSGGVLTAPPARRIGGFPTRLLLADIDGAAGPEALVLLAKEDGLGIARFAAGRIEPGPLVKVGPTPRGLNVTDLEGDGRTDLALLVSDAHGSRVVGVSQGPAGNWRPREDLAAPDLGGRARDLLARDLSGDGAADLVFVDEEGGRLGWLESQALAGGRPGWRERRELSLGPAPRRVIALDEDPSPAPLLAVALAGAGAGRGIAFVEARVGPEGLALAVRSRVELPLGAIDLAPADLDGDGDSDLVALLSPPSEGARGALVALYREGDSWRAAEPLATSAGLRHLALGDLDGDGALDALVAAQYAHVIDLFLGRPGSAAGFTPADGLGAAIGPFDVAASDFTRDGRLDVLAVGAHSDQLVLLAGTAQPSSEALEHLDESE